MRSACLVRTRFILHNFSGIGLGEPRTPRTPLWLRPCVPRRQSHLNTFTCTVHLLPPVFNLAQLSGRIAYSLYQGHTGIRRAVEILNLLR